jgi:hypothetical protein
VVEATPLELLAGMDTDMSQDLEHVIKTEARNMLMHQADLLGVTDDADWDGDGFRDDKTKTAKRKAKKKAAEEAERATLPLKTPNDASCWYYSNGLECPNKFKDSTGQCKYQHLHKHCGMPLQGGGYCKDNHRAADHK